MLEYAWVQMNSRSIFTNNTCPLSSSFSYIHWLPFVKMKDIKLFHKDEFSAIQIFFQGAPLLPFQADTNEQGQKVLTSYLFPQQKMSPPENSYDVMGQFCQDVSDTESLTSSVWDLEYRKRCKVAFKFDSDLMRSQSERPRTIFYPKESSHVRTQQRLTPVHASFSDDQILGPKFDYNPEPMVTYFVSGPPSPV